MQDRFVSTPRGRVHFQHGGKGPALVLLHSNGGSSFDFETVVERLGASFELFVWDMPGQGDSDPLAGHLGVRDYADATVGFMDALGVKRASVLGVSIGGAVCVALGAHHAERVDTLFVVECPYRPETEWRQQWPRIESNFGLPFQTIEAVKPRVNEVSDAFMLRWNIDRSKAGAKTMMSVMWALREYDADADLASFKADAVVVYGDRGPTIGISKPFIEKFSKPPRVEIMRGSGHFPMFDAPDEFCAIVERHAGAGAPNRGDRR